MDIDLEAVARRVPQVEFDIAIFFAIRSIGAEPTSDLILDEALSAERVLSHLGGDTTILMLAIDVGRGRLVKEKSISLANDSIGGLRSLGWIWMLEDIDLGLKVGDDIGSEVVDSALHLSELLLTEIFVSSEPTLPIFVWSEIGVHESIEEVLTVIHQ